ncbi:glycosyltransferase [Arsenicicoccus dermatophilus]|uniref:glycosyltransferase n=1 Tax=Arsenicicoccus dermatophilus TaxID=1076331 RepID=UPI001F4CF430|nr:glycosyltransferase [Arsenicicoccus dermatophilus]
MTFDSARPRASVIIPAHDEGRVISDCLQALRTAAGEIPLDVVVAANGCTDDTVERARAFPGVRVLDLATPSKVAALNAGDEAARTFPRIYLDADIVLSREALRDMISALDTDRAITSGPTVQFATTGSSWPVRAFYSVFAELPYVQNKLVGLGVYGLNAAGRARFDRFPDLTSDDLFVQRLFSAEERVVVPSTFLVQVPRTLTNLLRVRVRVAKGNRQLAEHGPEAAEGDFTPSTGGTVSAIVRLVRRSPAAIPAVLVYLAVTVVARWRARRASATQWERDTSTR